MSEPAVIPVDAADRRRRIRRTAVLLAIIAIAFYVGFIAMSVMRSLK
jgi:hypothetical protein